MNRRHFSRQLLAQGLGLSGLIALAHQRAWALSLADLTSAEASQGLKAALEKGAVVAVDLLGKPGGFLNNDRVRIQLPGALNEAAKLARALGQGKKVDELVESMNHAAETAVPMAKNMLVGAVKSMSVNDAKAILTGGENSVTQFFANKTRAPLSTQFLPVVTKVVEKVGLAQRYNEFAAKAAGMGLVRQEDASIQRYVTGKSLDGLYTIIGDQERKIRQDPVGTGSAIIGKVFGAIR